MTPDVTVVEIGPADVRAGPGPGTAPGRAAVEFVDDDLALISGVPVDVDELWRDVLAGVSGPAGTPTVIVCPAWWSRRRLDRVRRAAGAVCAPVVALERNRVLRAAPGPEVAAVVEIAGEFVVVSPAGAVESVVARPSGPAGPEDTVDAVCAALPGAGAVLIDAPAGAAGAPALAALIAERVRATGTSATIADPDLVRRSAAGLAGPFHGGGARRWWRTPWGAVGAAGAAAALTLGLVGPPSGGGGASAAAVPMTLLVEGRVGVLVPAGWTVARITSGPGSSRVRVAPRDDGVDAVFVVQSPIPLGQPLAAAAQVLQQALDEQPPGVFVDFDPDTSRMGRPAVTYTEARAQHRTQWTVVLDGAVRIGIGCQSTPGGATPVQAICDEAVRSAHALF